VAEYLAHIDFLEAAIDRVSAEIAERLRPCAAAVARLDTIPGIGPYLAEALIAEIGTDLSRFPTAAHLARWAGMCPGNHESAGNRRSSKTRNGSPWLRALLVQAAHAGARKTDTSLGAQSRRVAARRGKSRAAVAVGHAILIIAYHLLRDGIDYHDLGPRYFDERDRRAVERQLVHRLEGLGSTVSLQPAAWNVDGASYFQTIFSPGGKVFETGLGWVWKVDELRTPALNKKNRAQSRPGRPRWCR
jgi:transposase